MASLLDHTGIPIARASELSASGRGIAPDRDPSLTRLRVGVYADAAAVEAASRDLRYLARIRAVAATRQKPVFARESALAIHGIPYGLEPSDVFTIGGMGTARRKAGVVHSAVALDDADVIVVDGMRVCAPAFALADVARRQDPLVSVSALDWALRSGAVSRADVLEALARQSVRGRKLAEWVIEFADPRAESVGESRSRVRIHQLGFALPDLQVRVMGRSGKEYRPDMMWLREGRRPLFGEFDGLQKYGALASQAGKTGARALAEEKAREDDMRFVGDVARWVWNDLQHPAQLERILLAHGVPRLRRSVLDVLRAN